MNYKILKSCFEINEEWGGCDGEKKETLTLNLGWPVGVGKRLILRFCLSSSTSLSPTRMSRGGGRGGRGFRGGGRGGFGGASNLPPMGLSFADIQNLSREASALYPVCWWTALFYPMDWLCGYIATACPSIRRVFEWRKAHNWAPARICRSDEKITVLYCWENKIFRQVKVHHPVSLFAHFFSIFPRTWAVFW